MLIIVHCGNFCFYVLCILWGVIPIDTVDRIFQLVDDKYKEQRDFAIELGVTPSIVSEWRRRKSASYQKRLPQISEVLGTTTEYLLTGNGPKYKTAPADVSNSDTQNEGQLMAAFFEGGKDLSEEEMAVLWQDAKDYIQWKLSQRRKAKDDQ